MKRRECGLIYLCIVGGRKRYKCASVFIGSKVKEKRALRPYLRWLNAQSALPPPATEDKLFLFTKHFSRDKIKVKHPLRVRPLHLLHLLHRVASVASVANVANVASVADVAHLLATIVSLRANIMGVAIS